MTGLLLFFIIPSILAQAVKIDAQLCHGSNQIVCSNDGRLCPVPKVYPGRYIRVKGYTSSIADIFSINLQQGANNNFGNEIALHVVVRFSTGVLALNSMTLSDDKFEWGQEVGNLSPVSRGDEFEVGILCDKHALKIFINGQLFTEYQHRTTYQHISHLHFVGDIIVQNISYGDNAVSYQKITNNTYVTPTK